MKRLFLILTILLIFPGLLAAQTLSLKSVNDDLHTNYSTTTVYQAWVAAQGYLKTEDFSNYRLVADSYTTSEVDTKLALKLDASVISDYATTASVSVKADKTYVDTTDEILAAAVAIKANSTDVYTTAEITALLADKADTASVSVKADKTYVDTTDEILAAAVAIKANSTDVYTTAAVDLLLLDKSDTAAVALKADKTYVDGSDAVFLAHGNATSGAHAATAISTTNWSNVQTCIDSIENAINGIITGSGFATMAWVNATVEAALSSAGGKAVEDVGTYISDNKTWEFSTNYDTSCITIYRNRLLQPRSLFTSSVVSNKTRVTYNSVIDASDEIILISNK